MSSSLFKQVSLLRQVGNSFASQKGGNLFSRLNSLQPRIPSKIPLLQRRSFRTPTTPQQLRPARYPKVMRDLHLLSIGLVGTCYASVLAKKLLKANPDLQEFFKKRPNLQEFLMQDVHKPVGVSLLTLLLFARAPARFYYHLAKKMPAHLPGPKWQQQAGDLAHFMFYPVLGLATTTGVSIGYLKGKPVPIWGLFNIPCSQEPDKEMQKNSRDAHKFFVDLLLPGMLVMHLLAVKYHLHLGHKPLQRIMPRMPHTSLMLPRSWQSPQMLFSKPQSSNMKAPIKPNRALLLHPAKAEATEPPESPSSGNSCKF